MTLKSLILMTEFWFYIWPFFWGNVIFKICHFCLKSHDWRTENFPFFGFPAKMFAHALKNEDSMNKEKRSLYVTLQCYNPGKLLKFLKFWKWHCLRKHGSRIKTPSLKWLVYRSRCYFAGKRIFYALMHSLIWFTVVPDLIIGVAFFLGHPV